MFGGGALLAEDDDDFDIEVVALLRPLGQGDRACPVKVLREVRGVDCERSFGFDGDVAASEEAPEVVGSKVQVTDVAGELLRGGEVAFPMRERVCGDALVGDAIVRNVAGAEEFRELAEAVLVEAVDIEVVVEVEVFDEPDRVGGGQVRAVCDCDCQPDSGFSTDISGRRQSLLSDRLGELACQAQVVHQG